MTGGRWQAGLAVAAALGLHMAGFTLRPDEAGAVSAGAGGEDLVSLQAADASITALVEDWDKPPEVVEETPPEPEVPQAFEPPPSLDTPPEIAPPPVQMTEALELPQLSEALPSVSPPPPPKPEPEPEKVEEKPKPKPKPKAEPKPAAKKKQPAAAARPAQQAAGSGGGAQAGADGSAQSATLSKARVNDLKAGWGAAIRSRIERRKSYPRAAQGAAGTVTVHLTVSRAGALSGVSVARSSGNAALDEAAIKAVRAAGRFPAAPKGLGEASYSFTLPMRFAR